MSTQSVQVFSTSGVPAPRKAQWWNALLGRVMDEMDVRPRDPLRFDGTLIRQRVGPITLFEVRCAGIQARHRGEGAVRNGSPSYQLLMPLQSEFTITHGSRAPATVGEGALCLIDRAERYEIGHGDGLRTIGIELPRAMLENALPDAPRHAGVVMRPDSPGTRVLGGLLRALGSELTGDSLADPLPPALARSIAGFVAAAYADVPRGATPRGLKARLAAYREFVDSRLCEGDFRPADVARQFNVSERYVRMVFQSAGEPLSAYLLRRRHEHAATLLRSSAYASHTIMDIALECGFNSASHFGQSFRQHFGQTPSEYRTGDGRGEAGGA